MKRKSLVIATGLLALLAPTILPAPTGLAAPAWLATGLAFTMALWWLTESLPLAATALLPLAAAPLLGLAALDEVASAYSDPVIILFLGGFFVAKAIEMSDLHRRLAFTLINAAGTRPDRVLAAVMAATAFLSLWISNTASAMVIAPVAAAIPATHDERPEFGTTLMLSVAFAATCGGMGSLIGTPPNAIFAAHLKASYGIEVSFVQWALLGVPVALILLVATWIVLKRLVPQGKSAPLTISLPDQPGRMTRAERRVATVAALTAGAWVCRPLIDWLFPNLGLTDAGIAMIAAVALFLVPDGAGGRLLNWEGVATVRWDVLILFGGGLALAALLDQTGLATWIGVQVEALKHLSSFLLLLIIAALVVYIGELASNTAMAALFLPITGAAAVSLELDPIGFMLPVALAASVGFMLPVATPPNAIVFANPAVSRQAMLRAGAPLDVIGILIAVGVGSLLGPAILN